MGLLLLLLLFESKSVRRTVFELPIRLLQIFPLAKLGFGEIELLAVVACCYCSAASILAAVYCYSGYVTAADCCCYASITTDWVTYEIFMLYAWLLYSICTACTGAAVVFKPPNGTALNCSKSESSLLSTKSSSI